MNPIFLAALHGYVKGAYLPKRAPGFQLHAHLTGPILEELAFRAVPIQASPGISPALTAASFAAAHFGEATRGLEPRFQAFRFADTFLGGLLYHQAYLRYGLFGAVAAHALHNIAIMAAPERPASSRMAVVRPAPRRTRR